MPPTFARLPATALPVDAVLFAMNVLVDPVAPAPDTAPRAVPGVRRLVVALAHAGLAPRALALRHQGTWKVALFQRTRRVPPAAAAAK